MTSTVTNERMEIPELTGDIVLADLIDEVCRYLNLRSLCRVARVCKSWNATVKRILQRRGMQRINLYENRYNLQFLYRSKVKPYIVLLFAIYDEFDAFDPRPTASFQFVKKYVNKAMLVGSSNLYTEESFNTDHDKYDEDACLNNLNLNKIPCLIIPKHNKLDVKFVCLSKTKIKEGSFNFKKAIDPLIPKENDTKTFLLLFTFKCKEGFLKRSVNYIKKSFQDKSYALWGSELFFSPLVHDSQNGTANQSAINHETEFAGISISSNNMDLFSTVYPCENIKISKVYQDLLKLKQNVKLKQHSMAFINGPTFEESYDDTSDEEGNQWISKKMDKFYSDDYEREYLYSFKKIFPDVPFISTFQSNILKSFGIDTIGPNKFSIHDEAITILIVTYN